MEVFVDPYLEIKIQKVLRYLPCSDCGDCDLEDCFAFAKEFINDSTRVCPHLTPHEHELLFLLINFEDFLYPLARRYIKEKKLNKSAITGVITVGNPDQNAPVVLTSNVLYEQSILNLLLKKAGISCYLLAIDTQGISTGEALFNAQISIYTLKQALETSHLEDLVNHRQIMMPRFAMYLSKPFERISSWQILPGPIHVSELPIFIEKNWYGTLYKENTADIQRILKLMPELNCGKCGHSTCLEFLKEVKKYKADVSSCPILVTPPYKFMRVWLENRFQPIKKYETGVILDSTRCSGCGICAKSCPANIAILENTDHPKPQPLFKIINGCSNILNYEECWRHKYLIPCQLCQDNCPNEAISFGPIPIYYEPTRALSKAVQKS